MLVVLPEPCESLFVRKNWELSLLFSAAVQNPPGLYPLGRSVQALFAGVPPVELLMVVQPAAVPLKFSVRIVIVYGLPVAPKVVVEPAQMAEGLDVAVAPVTAGADVIVVVAEAIQPLPSVPVTV